MNIGIISVKNSDQPPSISPEQVSKTTYIQNIFIYIYLNKVIIRLICISVYYTCFGCPLLNVRGDYE